MRTVVLLLTACFVAISAGAHIVADSTAIRFRCSSATIDPALGNNAEALQKLLRHVGAMRDSADETAAMSIRITGTASPEGSFQFNSRLSHRRAQALLDYINNLHATPIPDSIVSIGHTVCDWGTLRTLVENDSAVPARSQVLNILSDAGNPTTKRSSSATLRRLRLLDGGKPYAYLLANIFPALRATQIRVEYAIPTPAPAPAIGCVDVDIDVVDDQAPGVDQLTLPQDSVVSEPEPKLQAEAAATAQPHPFYMALKTNMLYDLLAVPAIGAEFYVGSNISIAANWMHAWWSCDRRHRYWRIYGGDLTLRYWFGQAANAKPLTGHHIGLYAGALTFDFELGGKAYMGGLPGHNITDRCIANAGVEYGYSLPVARRLNIDFTLGVGFMGGKVEKFKPVNGYYLWESTSRWRWFGPTKAEVSLVWLIGSGNFNQKRGGGL